MNEKRIEFIGNASEAYKHIAKTLVNEYIKDLDTFIIGQDFNNEDNFSSAIKEVLNFYISNKIKLKDDEIFISKNERIEEYSLGKEYKTPDTASEPLLFMPEESEIYINLRESSLLIALLLIPDEFLAEWLKILLVANGILKQNNPLLFIKEESGEKCIVMEARSKGKKGIKVSLFKKNKGECINNAYNCEFKHGDRCDCDEDKVREICASLEDKGVLKKMKEYWVYQI